MRLLHHTQADLTEKLKTARGAKRRKILRELQRRYDETATLTVKVCEQSGQEHYYINIPHYNFGLHIA